MNAFFASVEQAQRPYLKGKPTLVLSDPLGSPKGRRSVVAASSYEAKARGVTSAMPLFEALELCPEAILIGGNSYKYLSISLKILEIFEKYTDLVEPYSIDEAFLDVTSSMHLFGGVENIAILIKDEIKKRFGITCSVGVGPNKLVAKMVSEWEKPDGLVIVNPEELPEILWPLPVDEIPGIGRRRRIRLRLMGIETIGDLANHPIQNLRKAFGIIGEYLCCCAWGHDDSPVDPDISEAFPRSVSLSCTLKENLDDLEMLRSALLYMTDKLTWKLRKEHLLAKVISAGIRYSDLSFEFKQKRIALFSNDTSLFHKVTWKIIEDLLPLKMDVRLVGVSASWFKLQKSDQLSLFPVYRKRDDLTRAVDGLRDRFGGGAVFPASTLLTKDLFEYNS